MTTQKTKENINLLALFHGIYAGLLILGLGGLFAHYKILSTVMTNRELWEQQNPTMPFDPATFFAMFRWLYLLIGILLLLAILANALSAIFMRKKVNRMFSMIVAGLNCIQVPLGTVLGVFTLVVLEKDEAKALYAPGHAGEYHG